MKFSASDENELDDRSALAETPTPDIAFCAQPQSMGDFTYAIKNLSHAATEQIDRMDAAKSRLALLEEIRAHAEKKVWERAEREIRLQAEIDALHQAAAEQVKRIELAQAEARRLADEQVRSLEAAEVVRRMAAEARQRAAAEALQVTEAEAQRLANEDEQNLKHLETIRAKAEAATKQRAERQEQLDSQLLAYSEAAAEQLRRIEKAEVELGEAEDTLRQLEAKACQADEHLARRLAEIETLRQSVEAARDHTEAQVQAIAEAEQERLAAIESIHSRAIAEAEKRAAIERQLNTDLETLHQAQESQLKRIAEAQAEVQRVSEHCAGLRKKAEAEEQRIADLESRRRETEMNTQQHAEEEQQLLAEIEALEVLQADQLKRIAEAGMTLLLRQKELREAESAVSQTDLAVENDLASDHEDNTKSPTNDLPAQIDTAIAETANAWSISAGGNSDSSRNGEEAEWISDAGPGTSPLDPLELTQWGAQDAEGSADSGHSESNKRSSDDTLILTSLTSEHVELPDKLPEPVGFDQNDTFGSITRMFDDESEEVRNTAARALYDLSQNRAETFTRALREAPLERRLRIVRALEGSGLATEAIESLAGESREKTYDAFSMLFLMAKAGEFQSLLQTIEKHPTTGVRLSVIKLLTFTNRADIIPALRSLAVKGALPIEVRSALMESIYEISSNTREKTLTAA